MLQKIAILGTGAIGGSIGLDLTEAGFDVILIDAWPSHVDAMKEQGLRVSMPGSEHHMPVRAYHLHEIYTLNQIWAELLFITQYFFVIFFWNLLCFTG